MKSVYHYVANVATIVTVAAISLCSSSASVSATSFGQTEVDQSKFIAVASPYRGGNAHQLLILEQISDRRPCWSEFTGTPTIIEPLLLDFDFTGICARSTDSNGYSIRINGEDFGLRYSLRIVQHHQDMLLMGAPSRRHDPHILIGRTSGITDDFAKIVLNPGWRFTKRTYADRPLGHVYLTYEGDLTATLIEGITTGGREIITDVPVELCLNIR